jgi:hypothetical protein
MKALATLTALGVLVTGTLATGSAAASAPSQPTAVERLIRQEDARGGHANAVSAAIDGSPDAIDRYQTANAEGQATPSIQGSPDAVDRYRTTHEPVLTTPAIQGSPDALDRYAGRAVVTGPGGSGFKSKDIGIGAASPSQPTAIERLVRQEDARRNDPALGITRATQVISVPTPPRIEVVARDGFDWLDAVIGAAALVAIVAALGGATLVVRVLTPRHA